MIFDIQPLSRVDARRTRRKKVPLRGVPRIDMRGVIEDYFGDLRGITSDMESRIREALLDDIEVLIPEPEDTAGVGATRLSEIERRIDLLAEAAERTTDNARRIAVSAGDETQLVHGEQQQRQLRAVGVQLYREAPELGTIMQSFVRVNTRLITSIPRDQLERVERIVTNAVTAGRRHESVAKDIEREFEISENRAKLIARDQIQKAQADLSRRRMEANGVERAVWRTLRDERVRQEHEDREGVTFRLSSGLDGERPGEPINCRCYPEPIL